ncbi:MAG: hypothetical protein HC910_21925 [Spirulinaceae cyanobacterium SM2_1_0]|nr:hypothetical protein [Spirulinaceae cyanobacterium SM2_1_0]
MTLSDANKKKIRDYLRYPYGYKNTLSDYLDGMSLEHKTDWETDVQAVLADLDAWKTDQQVAIGDRTRFAERIEVSGEYVVVNSAELLPDIRQRESDLLGRLIRLVGLELYSQQARIERN